MDDRAFSHVKGWNWIMQNWNAHFSATAKAVRCYYELENIAIFPYKIILSIAIMELSEFSIGRLLFIICHPVSRYSKSLCCQPKCKSGESKGHRYTCCLFWQLNFISTSMLPHPEKKPFTDVSGAMGAIDVSHSGLNPVEGQKMLFPYLKPELLALIANAFVHFSKNEHMCMLRYKLYHYHLSCESLPPRLQIRIPPKLPVPLLDKRLSVMYKLII